MNKRYPDYVERVADQVKYAEETLGYETYYEGLIAIADLKSLLSDAIRLREIDLQRKARAGEEHQ